LAQTAGFAYQHVSSFPNVSHVSRVIFVQLLLAYPTSTVRNKSKIWCVSSVLLGLASDLLMQGSAKGKHVGAGHSQSGYGEIFDAFTKAENVPAVSLVNRFWKKTKIVLKIL